MAIGKFCFLVFLLLFWRFVTFRLFFQRLSTSFKFFFPHVRAGFVVFLWCFFFFGGGRRRRLTGFFEVLWSLSLFLQKSPKLICIFSSVPETAVHIPIETLPLLNRLEDFLAKSFIGHFCLFEVGFSHNKMRVLTDFQIFIHCDPRTFSADLLCFLGHSPSLDFCAGGYLCLSIVFDVCRYRLATTQSQNILSNNCFNWSSFGMCFFEFFCLFLFFFLT